ncbi:MAG: DUF4056 domain-containing protein [Bdellovibrionota bacterium]|mgnify:CR=1 FL=1
MNRAFTLLLLLIVRGVAASDSTYLANVSDADLLLTDPQKKSRPCMCQFGYGLYFHHIPVNEVTQIIEPGRWGNHSFGRPSRREKNGLIYTCRGGFVDSSHARAGADWTAHLAVRIARFLADPSQGEFLKMDFAPDRAALRIEIPRPAVALRDADILVLAQRIAYERLLWHEIGSWYTTPPIKIVSERISAFSPEDAYSNLLGTYIGAEAIANATPSFTRAVDAAIQNWMKELGEVDSVDATKAAFDAVDGDWWDKKGSFPSPECVMKREVRVFGQVQPWLIPTPEVAGCGADSQPKTLAVPDRTLDGRMLTDLYRFLITPEDKIFTKTDGVRLPPVFSSAELPGIVDLVAQDLRRVLGPYSTPSNSPSSNRSSSSAQ